MTASLGGLLTVGDLLPEMALYKVTAPCVGIGRLLLGTDCLCPWAARVEAAAGWQVKRARHIAGEDNPMPLGFNLWVRYRHRGEQRLGVWVQWILVQLSASGLLNELAEIHHRDEIADMPNHTQVVGDEQVG